MEKDAKDKNLNIFFSGNVKVDDVRNYMNVMDMMLLPSRNEGLFIFFFICFFDMASYVYHYHNK